MSVTAAFEMPASPSSDGTKTAKASESNTTSVDNYSEIVSKQRELFASGATAPASARKERLSTLKKLIVDNAEELCGAVYMDLRRLPGQTRMIEIPYAVQEIEYMLQNLDEWMQPQYVSKTLMNCLDQPMLVKEPLGVVLIISPWNYPVDMILRPLVAVIAAGNTAVIKPSEVAPNTAAAFARIFPKYFEPEFCNVVLGGVPETTALLEQRFDHIFYTGSPGVAKVIMAAAAKHLTPVTLELGGKCPAVVLNDANIETTAKRIAWGKWMNCGQTCVAPDYVLVTPAVKDKLIASIKTSLETFYGLEIKMSKDYSRIVNERHFDRLTKLLSETKGKILFSGGDSDRSDLFISPTLVEVHKDDPLMTDEIFGPILPIITVKTLSEAIEFINCGEKPLAAYIFTTSDNSANRLITETSSGGVCVNDVVMHILVDTLPFGGVGKSGMGRYHGKFGFNTFTHEKAVLKRGFFGESFYSIRYPLLTEKKQKLIEQLPGRREMPSFLSWIGRVPYMFMD